MINKSITFILPGINLRPGGGAKIVFEYANRLNERGYKVNIVHLGEYTFRSIKAPKYIKHALIRVLHLRGIRWFKLNKSVKHYLVFDYNINLVPPSDYVVATAAVTARFTNSLPTEKGKKLYLIQDYEIWDMGKADLLKTYNYGMENIAISKWLQEVVLDACGQCDLIPNPIDTDVFYPEAGIIREPHAISVMYHEMEHKGFKYAWNGIIKAREVVPDINVYMFGIYKRPKWLPSWVKYIQNATEDQLRLIYSSTRAYVCASIKEGYGLTCVESMACGCALVVTDFDGSREYAVNETNALVVPIRDSNAIASSLIRLLTDEDVFQRLSNHAMVDAKKRNWTTAVSNFESLLNE